MISSGPLAGGHLQSFTGKNQRKDANPSSSTSSAYSSAKRGRDSEEEGKEEEELGQHQL
jgi:hypothetical protein